MSFAANLKYMKDLTGLTNYQLSKELECSQSSIKNWIDGENIPHKKTRQRIADHFGITLAELDGDELPVLPPDGAKKALATEGEGSREAVSNFISNTNDRAALLAIINEATKKLQEME